MGKLAHYSKRYLPAIIIALVLGAFGTVCQIVGPDKLKDITNEITKGLPAIVHGRPVLNSIDLDAVTHIGFTLVALRGEEPIGYLSADLSWGSSGGADLHVDMIQISADHRGQRLGSALMAGLAELAAREIDAQRTRGAEPDWSVSADTQTEAAGRLTDQLQTVLDDLVEPCVELSPDPLEEGPQT